MTDRMGIFISHLHEDGLLASAVKAELDQIFGAMVSVFLAEEIPLGVDWFNEIRLALTRARFVLVIFSKESETRPWLNIEAGFAAMMPEAIRVVPLCKPGYSVDQLPIIYRRLQAVRLDEQNDISTLLRQIASETAAGRLIANEDVAVACWIRNVRAAILRSPRRALTGGGAPCVWIIGSDRGLPDPVRAVLGKLIAVIAPMMIQAGFRLVFGRSRMLEALGDAATATDAGHSARSDSILTTYAVASAATIIAHPNPVVILGSLRSRAGPRAIFEAAIGRVPDVALLLGGAHGGRAAEEVALAAEAAIPVLALPFTGGIATETRSTFSEELQVEEVLAGLDRRLDAAPAVIRKLIEAQVSLVRS